jgi:transcriptional regulator with XRE-family HTH domain
VYAPISSRLKKARKTLGLSQLELSQKSGISQASIARIEAGTQENLRTDTIRRLAVALQIPLPQFWDEPGVVREESAIYNAARLLPVVLWEQLLAARRTAFRTWNTAIFEPSYSHDERAFFLQISDPLAVPPELLKDDLVLIEPDTLIHNSDIVLLFIEKTAFIGRIYRHIPSYIMQPLDRNAPPVTFPSAGRKLKTIQMLRISEVRRKY